MSVMETSLHPAPWLSVLVPAYNAATYLAECVDSVLSQGVRGVEVVVVDDCSSDASAEILVQLSARWPDVLHVRRHDQNRGLSAARNTLLQEARGEHIWFLDADDKLLIGSLTELQRIVNSFSPDLVLCDFEVLRSHRQLKHWMRGEYHRKSFLGTSGKVLTDTAELLSGMLLAGQLHAWSKISRRRLWQTGLCFPPGEYFEDMATMTLLALKARSSYYAPHAWVAYRQHEHSILANANWRKAQNQSRALVPLKDALRSQACGETAQVRIALAHQSARNYIGAMRYLHAKAGTEKSCEQVRMRADELRQNFLDSSPLSAQELARAYLQRGWLLRRHRFLSWYGAFRV